MNNMITIRGNGFAAAACARLLADAGLPARIQPNSRPRIPAVLAGPATLSLLSDIFPIPNLLHGFHAIHSRIVAWTPNAEPVTLPHTGRVIPEQTLLDRLWPHIPTTETNPTPNTAFTIHTFPHPSLPEPQPIGHRHTTIAQVQLLRSADPHACYTESVPDGWLFLLPTGPTTANLLATGPDLETLVAQSRLIAPLVTGQTNPTQFPSHPRILPQLTAPLHLAAGSAAMAFDPLCGEGAGHALREAILAAAVLRSGHPASALDYYEARLAAGFLRHLETCRHFYQSAHSTPWWTAQLESLRQGISSLQTRLAQHPPPRHRLSGFDLITIS